MIVIDCSYALAMVMPDEMRPASLAQVVTGRLLVPPIWPYEVANAFRSAVRRGRVAEPEILGVCSRIEGLQFELAGTHDSLVRQRYLAALPVIGISGHAFSEDVARCLQAGMTDSLTKPLSRVAMLQKLMSVLESRQTDNVEF